MREYRETGNMQNESSRSLKENYEAGIRKQLAENPPEIPTYEQFSRMIDNDMAAYRRRKRRRIIGIAACFAVIVMVSIFVFGLPNSDVDADKSPKEEIATENGVIIEDGGWGSSEGADNVWSTTEWEHVELVKEIYPQILIPNYIPNGYDFKKLTVKCLETGAVECKYIFVDDEDMLKINMIFSDMLLESLEINDVIKQIESKMGTIYIQAEKNKIATIQTDDGVNICIAGNIADEEIVNIVENLVE